MLKPLGSPTRLVIDLSGTFRAWWGGRLEAEDLLLGRGYDRLLAVPAAWNYQYPDLYQYSGDVWYCREFYIPEYARERDIVLRFEAANERARVFVNGRLAGRHEGGFLPFEVDITPYAHFNQANLLAVQVGAGLRAETATTSKYNSYGADKEAGNRSAEPWFGGLIRSLRLLVLPRRRIVEFTWWMEQDDDGVVLRYEVEHTGGRPRVEMAGMEAAGERGCIRPPSPRWWSPEDPFMYPVSVRLYDEAGKLTDEYLDRVGLRSLEMGETGLAVNGKEVFLFGADRHDDFPVVGSGEVRALYMRDLALMRLLGMNALQPGGHPPSWELADLCDRTGMMLIVQCPEVDMSSAGGLERNKRMAEQTIKSLRNHPSIAAWMLSRHVQTGSEKDADALRDLCYHVRDMDSSRLLAYVNTSGMADKVGDAFDFQFVEVPVVEGDAGKGSAAEGYREVTTTVDGMYHRHGRPVVVGGSGGCLGDAGGCSGTAGTGGGVPWLDHFRNRDSVCGAMINCLADYAGSDRTGITFVKEEGILTRDREPKDAAWELHRRYSDTSRAREGSRTG